MVKPTRAQLVIIDKIPMASITCCQTPIPLALWASGLCVCRVSFQAPIRKEEKVEEKKRSDRCVR